MAKVIKAGFARILEHKAEEPKEVLPEEASDPAPEIPFTAEEDIDDTPLPRTTPQEEFQAAYDELILAAQDEVQIMMEEARREAATAVQGARQEAVEIEREARQRGYDDGLRQGQEQTEQGLRQAQDEIQAVLDAAYAERDRLLREAEPQIVELSLEIAHKVLGYELDRSEDAFVKMVQKALESVQNEKHVVLHVNADDYLRFFQDREIGVHTESGPVTARVQGDPELAQYSLSIETDSGTVDAGLDTQLEQIGRQVTGLGN